jgi:hypothetical protein
MDTQPDHDLLSQEVLDLLSFSALTTEQRLQLLSGPTVKLVVSLERGWIMPKRLLLAMSPVYSRILRADPRAEYWAIPVDDWAQERNGDVVHHTMAWMLSICSADPSVALPRLPLTHDGQLDHLVQRLVLALEMSFTFVQLSSSPV